MRHCRTRRAFLAQSLAAFGGPVIAQQPALTYVYVTVRDSKGSIAGELELQDFQLFEDGRQQSIRSFVREADHPLTLGLLVDPAVTGAASIETERRATRVFFTQMLRPDVDSAFLLRFNDGLELLQSPTTSREQLDRALALLPERQPTSRPDAAGVSNAIQLAAGELMRPRAGRKALIVLADIDRVGQRTDGAVMTALETGTIVYTIRLSRGVSPPRIPGMTDPPGVRALLEIARRTGGSYFEATRRSPLQQIYAQVEEELRNQYRLGYVPDAATASGFRLVRVEIRGKGHMVQAPEGYYPPQR